METANQISIEECCSYYSIEASFIRSLDEYGLIELKQEQDAYFISFEQLADLEKYMHMHYDMDINMEGLEAITHLLNRIHALQHEIKRLRNELGR
ncbi:hypothetical protein A8C56_14360 [Niabella ginsenosidivorans]|uniref:MerR family transcriptional regulator n=1 Tax=Niabella ginsenosidivorans TaxID=1176587 RepID=A0A1A9I3V2_9BACT|nr:chaperone modulator CbpM [Niabella ginsenosidivorans]ANH81995.1 hypothetical protein A8C56_14360 [Niabella ginsenosidivorans]